MTEHGRKGNLFLLLLFCGFFGRQQGFLEILQNPGEQEKNTGDNEGSQHNPVIGIPDAEKAEQCAYAKGNGRRKDTAYRHHHTVFFCTVDVIRYFILTDGMQGKRDGLEQTDKQQPDICPCGNFLQHAERQIEKKQQTAGNLHQSCPTQNGSLVRKTGAEQDGQHIDCLKQRSVQIDILFRKARDAEECLHQGTVGTEKCCSAKGIRQNRTDFILKDCGIFCIHILVFHKLLHVSNPLFYPRQQGCT